MLTGKYRVPGDSSNEYLIIINFIQSEYIEVKEA